MYHENLPSNLLLYWFLPQKRAVCPTMDTQTKQELERLYGLAKSATATTNFYNQVDKYIGGISTRTLTLKLTKLVD